MDLHQDLKLERWENRPAIGVKTLAVYPYRITVYPPWTKVDGLIREYELEKKQGRELDEWKRTGEVVLPKYSYAYFKKVQEWLENDPYEITAPEQVKQSTQKWFGELFL